MIKQGASKKDQEMQRTAIVTGAARPWGLGRATAREMAQRGYAVGIIDIRDDWGREAAADIAAETGQRVEYIRADISVRDEVTAAADRMTTLFGRIDALFNVAAVGGSAKTADFTDEQFHRVMAINLLGPMLCAQAVIPAMTRQKYGRIVNVASSSPYMPPPVSQSSVALYMASKGGLIAWTKSAAVELAPLGIVTSVVAVGGFSTAMGAEEGPSPEVDEFMFKQIHRDLLPWGRLATVAEIAEVLADVGCASNHLMLGATIHASGGRVMPL